MKDVTMLAIILSLTREITQIIFNNIVYTDFDPGVELMNSYAHSYQ